LNLERNTNLQISARPASYIHLYSYTMVVIFMTWFK